MKTILFSLLAATSVFAATPPPQGIKTFEYASGECSIARWSWLTAAESDKNVWSVGASCTGAAILGIYGRLGDDANRAAFKKGIARYFSGAMPLAAGRPGVSVLRLSQGLAYTGVSFQTGGGTSGTPSSFGPTFGIPFNPQSTGQYRDGSDGDFYGDTIRTGALSGRRAAASCTERAPAAPARTEAWRSACRPC